MKISSTLTHISLVIIAVFLTGCEISEPPKYNYSQAKTYRDAQNYTPNNYYSSSPYARPATTQTTVSKQTLTAPTPPKRPVQRAAGTDINGLNRLYRDANVNVSILPTGSRSRTRRYMNPRYITIHSTQNRSRGADAWRHSAALRNGALGRIGWHFTTDEARTVQHIPTREQGNHAENYRGPGNMYSIGIEMCENVDNNIPDTIDRTAKLTAYLMHKHKIPLSNVKPHYHWPRNGFKVANKNCPHFLLDNGRPGRKWQNYLNLVDRYYQSATSF